MKNLLLMDFFLPKEIFHVNPKINNNFKNQFKICNLLEGTMKRFSPQE